ERAEFIRVQCAIASLILNTHTFTDGKQSHEVRCEDATRYKALRRRERELMDQNFGAWTDRLPESLVTRQCPHCEDQAPDWETNAVECRQCDGVGLMPDQDNVEFRRGF